MTHEEFQELLEGYVDETLDRTIRAEVDRHLEDCAECRQILDGVAAITLGRGPNGELDEHAIRRSVRRATWRTVIDAALMLLGLWLALWLVAVLVVQPLVVNRAGRAATLAEATLDLATMTNPGGWVTDLEIQSTALTRTVSVSLALPVGSEVQPLGVVSARIGPLGFGDADGGAFLPFVNADLGASGDARTLLPRLGSGTVSTVAVTFAEPLTIGEAQTIADTPDHDTAVTWVGFGLGAVAQGSPIGLMEGGTVGYSTCLEPEAVDRELLGATSASMSRGGGFSPADIGAARERVRSALTNLEDPAAADALSLAAPEQSFDPRRALTLLDRGAGVTWLVVTGPTDDVLGLLDDLPGASASLMAVDFYNWSLPVCGR